MHSVYLIPAPGCAEGLSAACRAHPGMGQAAERLQDGMGLQSTSALRDRGRCCHLANAPWQG